MAAGSVYWSQMCFAWLLSCLCECGLVVCEGLVVYFLCEDAGSAQDHKGMGSGVVWRAPGFPVKVVSDVCVWGGMLVCR